MLTRWCVNNCFNKMDRVKCVINCLKENWQNNQCFFIFRLFKIDLPSTYYQIRILFKLQNPRNWMNEKSIHTFISKNWPKSVDMYYILIVCIVERVKWREKGIGLHLLVCICIYWWPSPCVFTQDMYKYVL